MKKTTLLTFLILNTLLSIANIKMPDIFGDNMVLQRNKPINIWGWAKPNEKITVKFKQQTKVTTTNSKGKWIINLDPEQAGGPFSLKVYGKNSEEFKNILVGDVWLCSGQSNMEMPIAGWGKIYDYENEIKNADFPMIRHLKVPNTISTSLIENINRADWKVCSPATAGDFSAVAYFFARQMYNETKVPIGLINSSWGGTQSESWTSQEAFKQSEVFASMMLNLQTKIDSYTKALNETLQKNFEIKDSKSSKTKNKNLDNRNLEFDDSKWNDMKLPSLWEDQGLKGLDGVVWFRKYFFINANDIGKQAYLELALIDDTDETFVNGIKIGQTDKWDILRKYTIPPGILQLGKNVISIKVTDTKGSGGIYGDSTTLKITMDKDTLRLVGDWKFRIEAVTNKTQILEPNDFPSLLFNAMINPLLNFSIKGVLWYQGETNTPRSYQYRTAFPLMINDWRKQFNQGDFPFYFVQLATYGSKEANSKHGSLWAELREAQDMTLSLQNTGMAVITDIGDPLDVHPKNKQDVGKRLAAIALHNDYHKEGEFTGPMFKSMKIIDDKIKINFSHIGSGLLVKDKDGYIKGFEIAGADKVFHFAKATILENNIVVANDEVNNPIAVRYNWVDDASEGNLFNKELYPVAPFRTDNWPGITIEKKYGF